MSHVNTQISCTTSLDVPPPYTFAQYQTMLALVTRHEVLRAFIRRNQVGSEDRCGPRGLEKLQQYSYNNSRAGMKKPGGIVHEIYVTFTIPKPDTHKTLHKDRNGARVASRNILERILGLVHQLRTTQ